MLFNYTPISICKYQILSSEGFNSHRTKFDISSVIEKSCYGQLDFSRAVDSDVMEHDTVVVKEVSIDGGVAKIDRLRHLYHLKRNLVLWWLTYPPKELFVSKHPACVVQLVFCEFRQA